jgi:hypothetical protein
MASVDFGLRGPVSIGRRVVALEIDDEPLSLRTPSQGDYLSRFIASASRGRVLDLVRIDRRGLRHTYRIRPDSRFSDGNPVQTRHVLRAIRAALHEAVWQRYLACLVEVRGSGDEVVLTLSEPAGYLPALLATVDFAPIPSESGVGNGPYLPPVPVDGGYLLRPAPSAAADRTVADLYLSVQRDVDGVVERFESGKVDVTCSTAFPLHRLPDMQGDPSYRTAPTGITARLEPVPGSDLEMTAEHRRAIAAAVDRQQISEVLYRGVRPAEPWLLTPPAHRPLFSRPLVIGYHEYYPNRQIAELVGRQLERTLGLATELLPLDYASGSAAGADLLLVLRYPAFCHPYAVFEPCNLFVSDPQLDAALTELRLHVDWSEQTIRRALIRLAEVCPVIPVVHVDGHWLARPGLAGISRSMRGGSFAGPIRRYR